MQIITHDGLQMTWKRSEVSHDELEAVFAWTLKSFETCGWPAMQREDMLRTQLKQMTYDTRMVCMCIAATSTVLCSAAMQGTCSQHKQLHIV